MHFDSVGRGRRLALSALIALSLAGAPLFAATPVPQNLGSGLEVLLESYLAPPEGNFTDAFDIRWNTEAAADYANLALRDADGDRFVVDILPDRKGVDALRAELEAALPSLDIFAVDKKYRGTGILEGYVAIEDVQALARHKGVRSVFLAIRPTTSRSFAPKAGAAISADEKAQAQKPAALDEAAATPKVLPGGQLSKIGTVFDQGVIQHRVDQVSQLYNPVAPVNFTGNGITVGVISDSYDTATTGPDAIVAVNNFDLPGAAGNPNNNQPVVVLDDLPPAAINSDEGRGMAEIVHKMAPNARLGFTNGFSGQVAFANNVRAQAGIDEFEYPPAIQQGFKADVIVDDIGIAGEPFWGESVIGQAIDEVTALGVSYFSSAGNSTGSQAYESPLRIVPNGTGLTAATNAALAGTNISLAGVPPELYAGGFHNFNPNGLDVAQLVNLAATQAIEMQWDDPFDEAPIDLPDPPIYQGSGTVTGPTSSIAFDQNSTPPLPIFQAGQPIVIFETATNGSDLDGVVQVFDPLGGLIVEQDTVIDEVVVFYPNITGQYKIVVEPFSGTGTFDLDVFVGTGTAGVTTDFNLLVFTAAGAYSPTRSLFANNVANNRPFEFGNVAASVQQSQFVIARRNVPAATQVRPTRVRWYARTSATPAEYFQYTGPTNKGHSTAAGANAVAAYSVFRPNLPEAFTSSGPAVILFDENAQRLPVAEVRQTPRFAGADQGNTSFFIPGNDTQNDSDTSPNFGGTSAAAPHVAAIAALVLESRGGSGSVTPAQMRAILQASTFPHDLDPNAASAVAPTSDGGAVIVQIDSDASALQAQPLAGIGMNDNNAFKISYVGPGSLASITFNPNGDAARAGGVTAGNSGYVDDVGSNPATVTYFENSHPGAVFLPATKAFALGTLSGLTPADVTAPQSAAPFNGFSNLAPLPANGTTQFRTMTIGFPTGAFTDGRVLRFGVGRGNGHSANLTGGTGPNGGTVTLVTTADFLGGGVFIPSGQVVVDGMEFSGTTTAGGTFSGRIRNVLGAGWTNHDGYGFVNAAAAVGLVGQALSVASTGATPVSVPVGGNVQLTVAVNPATSPASSGTSVVANLSSIGGSATQTLFDNATNGDATPGDNIFSFNAVVAPGTVAGSKSLNVDVADNQGRTVNATIALAVQPASLPTATTSATPSSLAAGQPTVLTVTPSPGASPASTGLAVSADLSAIGGSAAQNFNDSGLNGDQTLGDGVFSFGITIDPVTAPGVKTLPVSITDDQNRTGTAAIGLNVQAPAASTPPTASALATPNTVTPGQSTVLLVSVTPGANPASSNVTVTADLSSIGGSAAQPLLDDGANGDQAAGDGFYAYRLTVPPATAGGNYTFPVTVGDGESRTANASIAIQVVTDGLFANGFEDP